MTTITLEEFKGPRRVQLTASQARMFEDELRRARGGGIVQLLRSVTAKSVRSFATAPECVITVDNGSRTVEYELYGRYFLKRRGERHMVTFYMGLLLTEWLYA